MVDTNLTGVWNTIKATVPAMIERGEGGSFVFVGSLFAFKGGFGMAPYVAAKHGVLGLMRTLALELAPHGMRANAVVPTSVGTEMLLNETTYGAMRPDLEKPTQDDALEVFTSVNALPVPWVEARDVSEAVLWLVSDEARYVTGAALPVDAGALAK